MSFSDTNDRQSHLENRQLTTCSHDCIGQQTLDCSEMKKLV